MAGSMIPLVAPHYTDQDGIRGAWYDDESEVRAFEEEFAEYVGCVGGVAVNSGTNALIVALTALETKMGEMVGLPSFCCRAVLDAVVSSTGHSALVDNLCDIPTANFSMGHADTDVVVVPHMFGTEAWDFVGLDQVAVHDITLSLGAVHAPQIGVCSFHRDKMISTGRGGMIVAQDQGFLDRCRELAYYDQPRNGTYSPAFSFGMTGMQAALGRSQLAQLPAFIERRREIAARYTEVFSQAGLETPDPGVESVFFRYIIGVYFDPADAVRRLADRGVECGRGVNPPLHRLLGLSSADFPGAEECFSTLLSIPVHPGLTDGQVEYVAGQVVEVCGR